MKFVFTLLFFYSFTFSISTQNFNGQWKGSFVDNTYGSLGLTGDNIDYVLELECNGTDVTGFSYTYFNEGNKRYYTICKLKGTIDKANKEVTVTEFERTKYNTPPDFRNCFQTHRLKYLKDSDASEILQGNWFPAPDQEGGCGYGRTKLFRRIIKKITPLVVAPVTKPPVRNNNQPFRDMNREPKKQTVIKPKTPQKNQITKPGNQNKPASITPPVVMKKDTAVLKEIADTKPPAKNTDKVFIPTGKFENRTNTLLKTIKIEQEKFTVDLYDNGEIDGDSVSVFYNGKLLVAHQRLSDKPIRLTLTLDDDRPVNELIMYAENLGEIPPNTALMIITDGDNRYEARLTSDLERNATVNFTHKK